MGMAASQARLLMLTARIHDVEYEAQSIQNAKIQLATQQDDVYQNYLKVLEEASLTFTSIDSSGQHSTMVANYNNLFSVSGANTANGKHYLLIDSRNRVVVSEDIYEAYQNFTASGLTQNANSFALYMMFGPNFNQDTDLRNVLNGIYSSNVANDSRLEELRSAISVHSMDPDGIENIFAPAFSGNFEEESQVLLNYFFTNYSTQLFNDNSMQDYNPADFNYYVRMFNAIQQHGGCISINDFDGPVSPAANNAEWLTAMIQSGQMTLEIVKTDNHGDTLITGTSPDSDSDITFTTTTQVDKSALAKAEAKYEHEMKLIQRKDKRLDLDLSKLETERTALTKQYDSMKKVVEDNIDRTFGIFS